MSESKTYIFGENQNGGSNGMLGLLAPLLQKQGVDPNVLLAMKGNNGFGGEGGWFMWVIFLFFLMGWGGNGWGGFGNNGRGGLANEINNDNGRALLMDAIGGNRNALSNLATQLNCTEGQIQNAISALTSQVQSVGNQVGMSGMQTINALQQGNMQIAQQIANCCCENRLAICQQTGKPIRMMSKEDIEDILKKNNIVLENNVGYDAVYIAHMCLADFYGSSITEEKQMAQFIKDYVDDEDQQDGFIFNRFYADTSFNGVGIPWEEIL